MGCRWVFVLVAYLIVLQWDTYQSAPVEHPCTNAQFRVPLNCIDWFPLYCYVFYPMSYCSLMTNNKQNGSNRRVPPNDVKITIPTAPKSGRTNIIIENRQLPKETSNYNCKPLVNDKNKVNIVVELKSEKGDERSSSKTSISSKSSTESSTINDTDIIEDELSTKTQPTSPNKDFDSDNNEMKANGIESTNKSTISTIIENSGVAVISYNETATIADAVIIATELHDATVTESSGVISGDDGKTSSLEGQSYISYEAEANSEDYALNTNSATMVIANGDNAATDSNGIGESENNINNAAITGSGTSIDGTVLESIGNYDTVTEKYGSDTISRTVTTGDDSGSNNENTFEVVSGSGDISIDMTVSSNSLITDTDNDNAIATGSITTAINEGISGETEVSSEATSEDYAVNTNSGAKVTGNDDNVATDITGNSMSENNNDDVTLTGSESSTEGIVEEVTGNYGTVIEKYGSDYVTTGDYSSTSNGITSEVVSSSGGIGIDMTVSTSSSTVNTDKANTFATGSIPAAITEGISGETEVSSEATSEDHAVNTNSGNLVTVNDDNAATNINDYARSENKNDDFAITESETSTESTVGEATGNYDIVTEKYGSDTTSRTVTMGDYSSTSNGNTSEIVSSSEDVGIDMALGTSSSTTDTDDDDAITTESITVGTVSISDRIEPSSEVTNEDDATSTNSVSIVTGNDEIAVTDVNSIIKLENNNNDAAIAASKTSKDGTIDEGIDNYGTVIEKYESNSTTHIVTTDSDFGASNGNISKVVSSYGDIDIGVTVGTSTSITDTDNNSAIATGSIPTAFTEDISGKSEPSSEATNEDDAANTNSVNTITDDATGSAMLRVVNTDGEVSNLSEGNVVVVKSTYEMISSNEDSQSGPDSDKAHQVFWSKVINSGMNNTADAGKQNNHTNTTDKENKPYNTINDSTTDNIDSALTLSTEGATDSIAGTISDDNDEIDDKKYT